MEPDETTNTTRARWFLWSVVALTALAAALRFPTLGLQSYRHDEAVTAGRVLVSSLSGTMHLVWTSESTPPLYYVLAWLWSHLFGVHEFGLRSLSALFGTATVPVSYLAGRELIGRRAGLAVAAIVAVNPVLVWYSQDARAYALLVLLSTAALLFFLRARRAARRGISAGGRRSLGPGPGDPLLRGLPARDRGGLAAGLGPSPAPASPGRSPRWPSPVWRWPRSRCTRRRARTTIGSRPFASPIACTTPGSPSSRAKPASSSTPWCRSRCFAGAIALLLLRGGAREKRGAGVALAIGGGAVALALLFAARRAGLRARAQPAAGADPAGHGRRGRDRGASQRPAGNRGRRLPRSLYWLAFCVYADFRPALQREDWRSMAEKIGPPQGRPRAIVVWEEGGEPWRSTSEGASTRRSGSTGATGRSRSLKSMSSAAGPPPRRHRALPPSFHQVQRVTQGRMTLIRYRAATAAAPALGRADPQLHRLRQQRRPARRAGKQLPRAASRHRRAGAAAASGARARRRGSASSGSAGRARRGSPGSSGSGRGSRSRSPGSR